MKKTLIFIIAITLVLLAAAFGLKGITHANTQKEHIWLMETLLPGGKDFVKIPYSEEDSLIRSIHKSSVGYVIETVTQGYADEITMLVGVNNDGSVTGLVVLRAHETLGIGSKVLNDHEFLSQFLSRSGSFVINTSSENAFSGATSEVTDGEITVDGISGATVSSKAVAKSVSAAVAYVTGTDAVSSATTWGG